MAKIIEMVVVDNRQIQFILVKHKNLGKEIKGSKNKYQNQG